MIHKPIPLMGIVTPVVEKQKEKKTEHEMETTEKKEIRILRGYIGVTSQKGL